MTTSHHDLFVSVLLAVALGAPIGAAVVAQRHQPGQGPARSMTFDVPESLTIEHEELHHELASATRRGGQTGAAAERVATLLHAHVMREEELALPPLALLRPLAAGHVSPEMRDVVSLTDRLKADLPRMLDEHQAILVALEGLAHAARVERHPEVVRFVGKLILHAHTEEQVLYPAALLVGEFLKLTFPD